MICTEALLFSIGKVAEWRDLKTTQFPDDPRNQLAAITLRQLARTSPRDIQPDLWMQLSDFAATPRFRESFNMATRQVGFQRHPKDLNDFIASFLPPAPTVR